MRFVIADSLVYVHQVFASTALTSVMSHFDSSLTLRERGPTADRLATATLLTFAQATVGLSALAQLPPRDLMGAVEAISDKISL